MSPTATASSDWRDVPTAPVVLLFGPEDFLATRARDNLRSKLRAQNADLEVISLEASAYSAGRLAQESSPSLFSEPKLIEVRGLASMTDDFLTDALAYLADPAPEVTVLLSHAGGTRGKKLLDALKTRGVPRIECQPLKKEQDKLSFASSEFKSAQRRISPEAIRSLVAAMGANLSELAAACQQLIADTTGVISVASVDLYYGGRVEATAFKVADAALAGNAALALSTLRHALSTGVDPVPMIAALAMKVRQVAKVHSARGGANQLARELGMAPWQVEAARRDASRWTSEGLVAAIKALAEADAEVKGAAKDPIYAVERAVILIATSAKY